MMSYTFFAPRDSAFVNLWPQDTADPFVIDDEFRREVLLNHFVRQRFYHDRDLVDGRTLTMAGNRTAKITRVDSTLKTAFRILMAFLNVNLFCHDRRNQDQ